MGKRESEFLDQNLFPGLSKFKGIAEFVATGPVAILGLLETAAVNGPQYSTLFAVDKEALRSNTYMVLLQAQTASYPYVPMDIDGFTVDYFRTGLRLNSTYPTENYSWDLWYAYGAPDTTDRYLQALNNASIAPLGTLDDAGFDSISIYTLKNLSNYTENGTIDLSGSDSNLQNLAFAVHTDIGNYAKARIVRLIDTTSGSTQYKDLVLEVCVYK